MYYVNSRYYDSETCRFISADDTDVLTVDQGSLNHYNLYLYCLNNPLNRIDSDGDFSLPNWAKVAVGAAAIAVGVAATALTGGAADGFMWGGITAGATFTTVAAKEFRFGKSEN